MRTLQHLKNVLGLLIYCTQRWCGYQVSKTTGNTTTSCLCCTRRIQGIVMEHPRHWSRGGCQKWQEEANTHDTLSRIKTYVDDIRTACQAHYHPRKELAVDERMVASKAKTGNTWRTSPQKSSNGYTMNFNVYIGKSHMSSVHGLSYDAVMDLIQPSYLRTGYHIVTDNYYTSTSLFLQLASVKFWACGTYRHDREGCPSGRANALTTKSKRGTVRWIREGPLVFVKWMDMREVSMCFTIHPAFSGDAVQRRVKGEDGHWTVKDIRCPTPVIAYNKNMGGVDRPDQLIQHYSTQRKIARWYRTLFLHFVDIATTNTYILHCEISNTQQAQHMTHKNFLVELVSQLCGVDKTGVPVNRSTGHVPFAVAVATDAKEKATKGRRTCQHCHQVDKKRNLTPGSASPVTCTLCVIVDRNCFEEWHRFKKMPLATPGTVVNICILFDFIWIWPLYVTSALFRSPSHSGNGSPVM